MKNILLLVSVSLLCFFKAGAKDTPATNTSKSLLWKVSGNGLAKPWYLFGTHHFICSEDYVWNGTIDSVFQQCDELCLEMDISNPEQVQQVMAGVMNTNGKTLKDYFSKATYEGLDTLLKEKMKIDIAQLAAMKPVVLLAIIETQAISCSGQQVSYETNLIEKAKEKNRKINSLETPAEAVGTFNSIPIDTVVKHIEQMLSGQSENAANHQKLMALYKQQDIDAMYDLVHASGALGDSEFAFLDERNKKWVKNMPHIGKNKTIFFAVGAGHLGGNNGIIKLLRKAGYTVTAVKNS